jgi:hypothetical protein
VPVLTAENFIGSTLGVLTVCLAPGQAARRTSCAGLGCSLRGLRLSVRIWKPGEEHAYGGSRGSIAFHEHRALLVDFLAKLSGPP